MLAPNEWLHQLETSSEQAYVELLTQTGSLAVAAYQVAQAHCAVRPVPTAIPTRLELGVAAALVAARAGIGDRVPPSSDLAQTCEARGLPVL